MGFVRISSNPQFIDGAVSPGEAAALLDQVMKSTGHEFWADDLSLVDTHYFNWSQIVGHRQLTDAYLLALAKQRNGSLATLDARIEALLPDLKQRKAYVEILTNGKRE